MTKPNRGKQFEDVIRSAFQKVPNTSIDRIPDQMSGYYGSKNICDFVVYKQPKLLFIECKAVYGNTFPLSRLTDNQYEGLLEKAKIEGVCAGVIIWFIDKDMTIFVPIYYIRALKAQNKKSIRYDNDIATKIDGTKRRIFFDYDMEKLLNEI